MREPSHGSKDLVDLVCAANRRASEFDNEMICAGAKAAAEWLFGNRDCILARKYEDSLLDCVVSLVGDRADPSFCELEELFRAGFYGVIGLSGPQNRNGVQ